MFADSISPTYNPIAGFHCSALCLQQEYLSMQIYAEAESKANLFALPRREQYMWRQPNIAKFCYARSKCSRKFRTPQDVPTLQMRPRLFYFLFTELSISEAISVLKNCSIRTASISYFGFNC